MNPPDLLEALCEAARQLDASDLFLSEGRLPQLRINGELAVAGEEPVGGPMLDWLWDRCGAPPGALDFDGSFVAADGRRYRVNFHRALERRGAVLRPIKTVVPPLEELGVPVEVLARWTAHKSGLVLVAGATGTGKSTTVAACLDRLNHEAARHIVTIEDPIEYLFQPDRCLFTQREVGVDTPSFAEGLRHSLRQSPDVIFLGEIRDRASAATALQAAETGHLVLATLHSSSVLDSLERLARIFEPGERDGVLHLLSQQLLGILCQMLVPALPGGRALAAEHFENQAVTRKWIAEGKFRELADFVARGDNPANRTFLHSLAALARAGRVAEAAALEHAANPAELRRLFKGINASSG